MMNMKCCKFKNLLHIVSNLILQLSTRMLTVASFFDTLTNIYWSVGSKLLVYKVGLNTLMSN